MNITMIVVTLQFNIMTGMTDFSLPPGTYNCDLHLSKFEVTTGMAGIYLSVCRHDGYYCNLYLSQFEFMTGMTDIYLSICRHDGHDYNLDISISLRY